MRDFTNQERKRAKMACLDEPMQGEASATTRSHKAAPACMTSCTAMASHVTHLHDLPTQISSRDAPVWHRQLPTLLTFFQPTTSSDAELTPFSFVASTFQQSSHLAYRSNVISSISMIVTLPVFHSNHNKYPYAHLRRFDYVYLANGDTTLAATTHLFTVSLDVEVTLWYNLIIIDITDPPWDAIRMVFLDFFRVPGEEDRAWDKLKALL
jgi:hypothetical protein